MWDDSKGNNSSGISTASCLFSQVILHSEDPAFVTECVLTFVGLLYPLQYLFPIIPLLPTSMPTAENVSCLLKNPSGNIVHYSWY